MHSLLNYEIIPHRDLGNAKQWRYLQQKVLTSQRTKIRKLETPIFREPICEKPWRTTGLAHDAICKVTIFLNFWIVKMAKKVEVPAGSIVALKPVPLDGFFEIYGPSSCDLRNDWSAMYAQFTAEHALSYLWNHFERGNSEVTLVALKSKVRLTAIVLNSPEVNKSMADPELRSSDKAQNAKELLGLSTDILLMSEIGTAYEGSFLVTFDGSQLECVIPHALIIRDNIWELKPLFTFQQNPRKPWALGRVMNACGESQSLNREVLESTQLLSQILQEDIPHISWII